MKKMILSCLIILTLFCLPLTALTDPGVPVEILYMNHGPLMPTLKDIRNLCNRYGNRITVAWYDYESKEGEQFMAKKRITQHVPLIIWINGKSTVTVNKKEIQFVGFPTGSGPAFFQGKWTIDDLRQALDQATRNKK
jgi:hypothetical protein